MSRPSTTRSDLPRSGPSTPVNKSDGLRRVDERQQQLPFGSETLLDYWWRRTLRLAAEAVDQLQLKEVAFALDVNKTGLEHALAEREHHHLRAKHLVFLLLHSKTDDLVALFAEARGRRLVPKEPMTAEQEIVKLKAAIAKAGPATQAFVESEVYGEDPAPFEKLK